MPRKKSPRKRINVKESLNPTFAVSRTGTRIRMSAFEISLRRQIKAAMETKDPKAINDLLNIFVEHKVIEPDRGVDIPSVARIPWFWDYEDFSNLVREAQETGKAPDRRVKYTQPLTAAGREDIVNKFAAHIEKRSKPKTPGVSYKKPPVDKQFKKGASGNPKGRPVTKNDRRAIAFRVGTEKHRVVESDRTREYTTAELLLTMLRNLSTQGKGNSYYNRKLKELIPEDPDHKRAVIVLPEPPPWDEFYAQLEKQQQYLQENAERLIEEAEKEAEARLKHREK